MKLNMPALVALMLLIALFTHFPAHAEEPKGGMISVEGTGLVEMVPDMASVSAGVQSRAKRVETALADNTTRMQALFAALEAAGIAKKDIQTSNFNIHPEIHYPKRDAKDPTPRIVGYQVNNQVSVTIRKLETIGAVLSSLVEAGANNLSGLQFGVSNKDSLIDAARKAAIKDARHKAELYAAELGVAIKRLTSLSEHGGHRPQPKLMRAMAMESAAAPVPVAEGALQMSVTVNTSWELDN